MPCEHREGMIICRRPPVIPKCKFCLKYDGTKMCDFPLSEGRTCDARICVRCTTVMGPDRDYCPNHRGLTPEVK